MTDSSTDGFGHTSEFSGQTTTNLVAASTSGGSSSDTTNANGDGLADTGESATWINFMAILCLLSGVLVLRKAIAR